MSVGTSYLQQERWKRVSLRAPAPAHFRRRCASAYVSLPPASGFGETGWRDESASVPAAPRFWVKHKLRLQNRHTQSSLNP